MDRNPADYRSLRLIKRAIFKQQNFRVSQGPPPVLRETILYKTVPRLDIIGVANIHLKLVHSRLVMV